MSYDLAVWEGGGPTADAEALAMFDRLYDQYMASVPLTPPTPRIQRYVDELLSRWPDIDSDAGRNSPWAGGRLIGNASGPMIYFAMVTGTAAEVVDEIAHLATASGLVCFDPQTATLR